MRAFFEVADAAFHHLKLATVTIAVIGAGDGFDLTGKFEFSDALELFAQDADLPLELSVVLGVLVLAAATFTEIRARRGHALGRVGQAFDDTGLDAAFHLQLHFFARKDIGREQNLSATPGQARAAIHEFFNFDGVGPLLRTVRLCFVYDKKYPLS